MSDATDVLMVKDPSWNAASLMPFEWCGTAGFSILLDCVSSCPFFLNKASGIPHARQLPARE
jgi:hypothetical protein